MTERRPRRRRAAPGGRILASGLSLSALFGMVAGVAAADRAVASTGDAATASPAQQDTAVTEAPAPPTIRVVVRVHRGAGATTSPGGQPAFTVPAPQPPVRRVVVRRAPAPVTQTHGSR